MLNSESRSGTILNTRDVITATEELDKCLLLAAGDVQVFLQPVGEIKDPFFLLDKLSGSLREVYATRSGHCDLLPG